ncbi:BTB/POZ domain-containing protein 9 [Aethina tumida]|uniref:BTB/POZ domain-containing protein 9 n=1 Tax=Aethina tumida TaxID=116153 RepID=UPI002147477B|nr:BTB/POZ domain-containing protein 9 [Aethina tumida]XP_019873289.2 BTB/POZ domain-containing protein 9 [Aethina tumida]
MERAGNIFIETRIVNPNKERLIEFYKDKKYADCTFKIKDEHFPAHRIHLACSSPVFERMLFGDMFSGEIIISDINPEVFRQVLDYIYTDNITLESMENAWSVYYIANKYLIESLIQCCLQYIKKNISMGSLAMCYEFADMYNLADIKVKCFSDMNNYLKAVFDCEYHMQPSTLCRILSENNYQLDGYELVMYILKWAIIGLERQNLNLSSDNVIKLLENLGVMKYIKKPSLSQKCGDCGEFLVSCECWGDLLHDTLMMIMDDKMDILEEPNEDNPKPSRISRVCRPRKVFKIAKRIDLFPYEKYVSRTSVKRDVILFGLLVNTEMNPGFVEGDTYDGSITIEIYDETNDCYIMKPTTITDNMRYDDQYYVNLKHLAYFTAKRIYKILISYANHTKTSSFLSIHCHYMSNPFDDGDCCFRFDDINGSVIKGITYYPY